MSKHFFYRAQDVRVPALDVIGAPDERELLMKQLGISGTGAAIEITRRSLDSRFHESKGIFYVYSLNVDSPVKLSKKALKPYDPERKDDAAVKVSSSPRVIIAGSGPAGLFAALRLTEAGIKPVILERGKDLEERQRDIDLFHLTGKLDPSSNVQFGLGGAGTYSDGKLNTRIKSRGISKVLTEFIRFGADPSIMYEARPHVGTDRLSVIIAGLRDHLISEGCEFRFSSALTDIAVTDGRVTGVTVNGNESIPCDELILAVGNAARDTFEMLFSRGVHTEQKAIAVGVRIEHPQSVMNAYTYGRYKDSPLPPAEFSVTYRDESGRGVYTFCNCPGGVVVNSSTEEGMLCVNGMSWSGRTGDTSNSALVVTVKQEDYPSEHPLAGIEFQRGIERRAYEAGGGNFSVPVQTIASFTGRDSSCSLSPTVGPQTKEADMNRIFPGFIAEPLRNALISCSERIRDFDTGIISAAETRTSCPVRLTRDPSTLMSVSIKNLYPAGEGAGYAGGIVSSAVDGIACADKISEKYQ